MYFQDILMPKVSVIVPIYNLSSMLRGTIGDVPIWKDLDPEVIVLDYDSTNLISKKELA